MASIPNERGVTAAPSRREQVALHVDGGVGLSRIGSRPAPAAKAADHVVAPAMMSAASASSHAFANACFAVAIALGVSSLGHPRCQISRNSPNAFSLPALSIERDLSMGDSGPRGRTPEGEDGPTSAGPPVKGVPPPGE